MGQYTTNGQKTNHFTLYPFILDPLTLGEKARIGVGGMMAAYSLYHIGSMAAVVMG